MSAGIAPLFAAMAGRFAGSIVPMIARVIAIEPAAPHKPALGQPCNGCGVCCLAEPCPVGMLVSRRRQGPCVAVIWEAATSRYRCGLASRPLAALGWRFAPGWLLRVFARLARRWISAGSGCDSTAPAARPAC